MTTKKTPRPYQKNPLSERIQKKFGSVRLFCKIAGLNEGKVRQDLWRDNPNAISERLRIEKLIGELSAPKAFVYDSDREAARVAIYTKYRNVTGFIEEHPQFSSSYISHLLKNGGIKHRKGKAQEFFKILNIK